MTVFAVAGVAIVAAMTALLLREIKPSLALAVSVCAGALLLIYSVISLSGVLDELKTITSNSGLDTDWLVMLIKALGLCYITGFSADCCRDAGETALSGRVELAGKIAVLVLIIPFFKEILQVIVKLV